MANEIDKKNFWTSVRTVAAISAETTVPASGLFIDLDCANLPEEVEIRLDTLTTTGSPSSVDVTVWRMTSDNKIDKLVASNFSSSDYTSPEPFILRFDAKKIYVTFNMTAGVAPTIATTVYARVVK